MAKEKLISYVKKYKYVALVVLAGVVLMLLPSGKGAQQTVSEQPVNVSEVYSLAETEKRLEQLLGRIRGVGQVQVMLTLHSGETLSLAEDSSATLGSGGDVRQDSQVLTVNRGSGKQEVVVTRRLYPTYQGAVVVCQGAGDSRVRLRVLETVSVLTGLSSDKISVVQWKQ